MRALFSQLLDLLYPPKCVFCRRLLRPEEHDVCARCAHELEPIPAPLRRGQFYTECYAVYPYEGVVAESLRRFKFSGQSQYAASFGRMLAPLLRTAPFEILSWVPVSAKRRRSRRAERLVRAADIAFFKISGGHAVPDENQSHLILVPIPQNTRYTRSALPAR